MAKDSNFAKQQQNWEKKREKLDRKRESARGSSRQNEKVQKADSKQRELFLKSQKVVDNSRVYLERFAASMLILGLYAVAILLVVRPQQGMDLAAQFKAPLPAAITALMLVALGSLIWLFPLKVEEKIDHAELIKSDLEKKQSDKEREKRDKERRTRQLKECKERTQRRAAKEKADLEKARAIARTLRDAREKREKQEAEEARAAAAAKPVDDGKVDEHGWTATQRRQLMEAVARYPESWSHSRKQRWEMIAAEVDKQAARACEETHARLEAEAKAAASSAKAERKDAKASSANAASSRGGDFLDDDLDWMGEGSETTMGAGFDESDEEDEEEEEEEEEGRKRMAVEHEPEKKGTEIRLEGIKSMLGCATVQVELLHLQLTCADCRTSTRLYLSGAEEEAADAKTWCEGCSGLISVHLRPTLIHQYSKSLCYVDCVRCSVTDVLPSILMSVCEACDAECVHKQEFQRNRMVHGECFKCHSKYVFGAESIRIEEITACDPGPSGRGSGQRRSSSEPDDPMDEIAEELRYLRKKAKSDPRQQLIKLGSPLPQMGACRHFKKSYKWYRFACCGRAFPCPECHAESGCPAASLGAHASRMICGKCSMEQSYSPVAPCEKCGFIMRARGGPHWDDGSGTRNLAVMSTKDSKKFKGGLRQVNSKTKTSSHKADRVGTKAKAKREHERKFGKDG